MSIIHFKESNVIFDIDELCYLKIEKNDERSKTESKIVAKFKNSPKEISIFYDTKESCEEKFAKILERIENTEIDTPITNCQWLYGGYLDRLCNLTNVDVISLESGVDPGGWSINVVMDNDSDGWDITYTSYDECIDNIGKIVSFIESGENLLILD